MKRLFISASVCVASLTEPRIFYMHVHGHGSAADLATKLKPALALIGKGSAPSPSPATPASPSGAKLDSVKIAQIVGAQGEQSV